MTGRTNVSIGGNTIGWIRVTYPSGSVCTCTNGSSTLTAKTTTGEYIFSIPTAGSWQVSCTNGNHTATSGWYAINKNSYIIVTLSYELYMIQDGSSTSAFNSWVRSGYTSGTWTEGSSDDDGNCWLFGTASVTNSVGDMYYASKITFPTAYQYLIMDCKARGYVRTAYSTPGFGVFEEPTTAASKYGTFVAATMLRSTSSTSYNSRTTYSLDISNISGDYYVGCQIVGSTSYSGGIRIYNLYFADEVPT